MNPNAAMRERLENYAKLQAELRRREERAYYEGDFRAFVEAGWTAVDSSEFQESWALDALCEHLQAVTRGDIKRLLVNFPPRAGKSNLCSIAWPAWVWAQSGENIRFTAGPQVRFLCGSYGHTLSLKMSTATRRLITSPFYQKYWGDRFELMGDQNAKHQFDNSLGGNRSATSIGSTLIGLGGDCVIVDDPHNTEAVESDAERETVLRWWKELRSTRLNDPKQTAIVVVMQRLHEQDVSGVILEDSEDWTHLCIPMRHDPGRHCVTVLKWDEDGQPEKVWEDPRDPTSKDLMWPERYGEREVQLLETELGPYMASGRLAQMPQPQGGGIIQREYWQEWKEAQFPPLSYVWASADTAYTEKEENDPTGFTCWGLWSDRGQPKVIMLTAWRKRLEIHGPNRWIDRNGVQQSIDRLKGEKYTEWVVRTQGKWGLCEWLHYSCTRFNCDKLLIEGKASGHSVAQELHRLHGSEPWGIELVTPEGDKTARLISVQATFAAGLVYAPFRDWSQEVIDEVSSYPKHKYKDLTDSCLSADTGIVTKRGVVPIADVVVGDQVMTHKGRWRRVTSTGSRPSDHYYILKAKGFEPIRVTGEHPALVMSVRIAQERRGEHRKEAQGVRWEDVSSLNPRPVFTKLRRGKLVRCVRDAAHDALVIPRPAPDPTLVRLDMLDYWPEAVADDAHIYARRNFYKKLNDAMVADIVAAKGTGVTQIALGQRYGVSNAVVSAIQRGWLLPSKGYRPRYDKVGRFVDLDAEAGWAMGLFAAEGCVASDQVTWSCDEAAIQRVGAWLSRVFGGAITMQSKVGAHSVTISSRMVAPLFAEFGHLAENKIVPPWVLSAPDAFVRGFVDGFAHGDGHRHKRCPTHVALTSTSKSLLWGLRLLLARLGMPAWNGTTKPAGLRKVFGGMSLCKAAYRIDYNEESTGFATIADEYLGTHIEQVDRVDQPLIVYNMSVEEDESYLTVGGLVHNCSQALKHVRDIGLLVRPEERQHADEVMGRHKPPLQPIYPA